VVKKVLIDIYKTILHVINMRLKDVLTKITTNKRNGQLVTCLRKGKLKKAGISKEELLNMKIDPKLKQILYEE